MYTVTKGRPVKCSVVALNVQIINCISYTAKNLLVIIAFVSSTVSVSFF